tara:strand:+ start:15338 stop:16567 length:1230 start_codon:yes stop_codon:yes gene_type:complete
MDYIHFKKKKLFVEKISATNLTKKIQTPFYCYSFSQLKENFNNFNKSFKSISPLICFSVKSNANLTILKELKKMGSGADVVSAGELLKASKAGINNKKIVFSGVGKTKEEIELAIKKRVLLINIESENEAKVINNISKKLSKITSVGIRLNPNVTGKTNKKISTGDKNDKFGLGYKDFLNLCKMIKKMKNLRLDGLSVHIGSQITNIQPFKQVLNVINKLINESKVNFKFIDLGGGMGISYKKKDKGLDLNQYAKLVKNFVKNKNVQIIFEPGRVIVGNTAVLISKIIYIKRSNNKYFIILDAGMNDLMRPALYDAYHQIIPIIKNKKRITQNIEFVGPICESSDKFLKQKNFSQIKEGDYIAITDVGAYGSSLSSNYNTRPLISEILVDNSNYRLIKKKQSLKNLINN